MSTNYVAELTVKFEVKEGVENVQTHTRTFTDWEGDWLRLHDKVRDYISNTFPNGELKCSHHVAHAEIRVENEDY